MRNPEQPGLSLMAGVRLCQLSKRIGRNLVVDGLTLEVADGEFMVLLGPSGCGKTTTLRIIAGLEAASAGEVYIGQRRVTEVEPKDRNIAMVFQSYALYPHMTVRENIAFGLRLRGLARAAIEQRMRETADLLGLAAKLDRRPAELSGGERQRVALGRAIVREPAVFLMDEPLSNLDAKLRAQTRVEIVRLHRRLGATFIYVTHDQVEAMSMADRVAVMNAGRLQQVGAAREIYERPVNRFVAQFIGAPPMNFIDGMLADEGGGRVTFCSAGLSFALSGLPAARLSDEGGREVTLGLRPEDLAVDDAASMQTAPGAGFKARVDWIEALGPEQHLFVSAAGHSLVVRAGREVALHAGDEVLVRPDLQRVHLFDRATGAAIV